MASGSGAALRLAQRLRELREREWDEVTVRQAHVATALDASPATVSSYESPTAPKTPTTARLTAYAQFFATRRSVNGKGPTLCDISSFTPDERERFEQLKTELFALHTAIDKEPVVEPVADEPRRRQILQFPGTDPVVIVCPAAPLDSLGPLADEKSLNHTRLHRFADADALLEVFGHIRALNPDLKVFHRLPSEVKQSDLQSHIVLLGGIGWNSTTRRILFHLKAELPIEQIDDVNVPEGEVFRVRKGIDRDEHTYLPIFDGDEGNGDRELVEDVGLLARLPNSFNFGRTMTICNGIFSKGVLGAALAITDETVRPTNEEYLAERFPQGDFAMLVRVPVVSGHPIAADLQNSHSRLFEWSPEPTAEEY
ncbi:helix-turn-helix transcriptional regulator [Pseudonocardia charpentierae]|uniref:Helix-turn-helix transcriptional regulator n=1 Tax=Pseudonocardia charpentierae TaxID=3075545 RepID=A0ABU2N6G9_9PSEU|nr:helix-turn-helix transcriptional regulator [Pseudonocardia sp. DSM 45834]MDT0349536.1 helix-turn-helix transcriptional regulator [Pseudonocardia sp. DSM 45834]